MIDTVGWRVCRVRGVTVDSASPATKVATANHADTSVTDRQTDGRTEGRTDGRTQTVRRL